MSDKKIMKRKLVSEMSYNEMLQSYSAVDLKAIAKAWSLTGLSKLKKDELIQLLDDYVMNELENKFYTFNLDHLSIVAELTKGNNVFKLYPIAAQELIDLGLILEGNLEEEKQIVMPSLVAERLSQFYNSNHEALAFNTILKDYMELTTSLYGVVTESFFVESFYEFNQGAIDKEIIENCLSYTVARTKNTLNENGYLHYYRLNEFETVYKDILTKEELTYVTIDQNILESFIKNGNILWDANFNKLEKVLIEHFNGHREMTLDIVDEMRIMLSYNHGISDFIQIFSKKYEDSDMVALKNFADAIITLHTEFPHWELKGQSPLSLSKIKQMPIIKGDKINRNDPCPCGSGKKYKKCCL